jgi:hypothetical protein
MPTKKRLPAASPPTASHMIQRNPDFGKKRRRKEWVTLYISVKN